MLARELAVRDYRSFAARELVLDGRVTVLVGRNAAGKTNLIEAIQLLTSGQSFRRPAPRELLREGASAGRARLRIEGEGRLVDMGLEVADGRRCFTRNGKRVTSAGVRGVLPSVLFTPDDLDMVKRGAGVRREALDGFGCQLNESYARLSATYARIVEQRNNLLRSCGDRPDPALLAAWDESLCTTGAALSQHRAALVSRIRTRFIEVMAGVAPGERVDVAYLPSVAAPDGTLPADREELVMLLAAEQVARRPEELRRRQTLVGPHRDDVLFTVDGRPARAFGSQGQQRSLVLAWKIAEVEVAADILGYPPILLLDDVMSELDARRRAAVLACIEGEVQTVITTTNLGYFDDAALERAKVVEIGGEEEGR